MMDKEKSCTLFGIKSYKLLNHILHIFLNIKTFHSIRSTLVDWFENSHFKTQEIVIKLP